VTAPDLTSVHRLTASAGLGPVREMLPLAGGANNRVFRVEAARGPALLKEYFRHANDPRDRLGAEFAFSRFAWAAGLRCVPQALVWDQGNALGLFEWVEGAKPGDATEALVSQATEFVRDLNASRWRPLASRLPAASEACFSLAEHLGTVARRVDRLTAATDPEATEFVRLELLPVWNRVRAACEADARDNRLSLDRSLDPPARCASPSDFGFHNVLVEADGRVRFLDFEYAGWDDPAKLVCDFFCQPAVPVPGHYFESFARAVAAGFPEPESVLRRARILLPVYRVKWVCIRLNEFLPAGTRRREFSLPPDELEGRQTRQLAAARGALRHHERIAA
jgi:hypothetical protein